MDSLVFIDTNIFLDFYRMTGQERALAILDRIDGNHGRFITGIQVEMEFKKNRQDVILATLNGIKAPDFGGTLSLPAFLSQSKQSKAIATFKKKTETLSKTLRERTKRVLKDPARYDPVYKVVQRLFRCRSPYNLTTRNDRHPDIIAAAKTRFELGYPPRKKQDTSMGDAVNWEWLVACAIVSGKDIVIVTRDGDYGQTIGNTPQLNDWLRQEFQDRVGKRRKLILTNKLSTGLSESGLSVTKKEVEEEDHFLEERTRWAPASGLHFVPTAGPAFVPMTVEDLLRSGYGNLCSGDVSWALPNVVTMADIERMGVFEEDVLKGHAAIVDEFVGGAHPATAEALAKQAEELRALTGAYRFSESESDNATKQALEAMAALESSKK